MKTSSLSSAASRAAGLAATLCAAVCLSSCFHAADSALAEDAPTKQFTFHVKGDFATSYEDFTKGCATKASNEGATRAATVPSASPEGESATRAASRLEATNAARLADLWVLDYDSNGTLLQVVHQDSAQTGFGSVPMSLTYGNHNIVFVASKGTSPSLSATVGSTSGSLSWQKAHDTFTLNYPVEVTASSNGNRAPELHRAVSGLKVVMTDPVPANAKSIRVEYMRSQSLSLPSLTAAAVSLSGVENDFPASWVGQTGAFTVYTLCPQDEMQTSVHILVTAKDGSTLSDFTVPDVPLKRNRLTTLTGEVFNRTSGFSVCVDSEWDTPLEVTF